jgi:hypothetical protein
MDRNRATVWALRALWVTLPFTLGPAVADAVADASRPVQVVVSVGLWGGWVAGLIAALLPTTVSLTVARLLAPTPLAVAICAAVAGASAVAAIVAGLIGALVLVVALRREVGRVFAQGSAYGDESRFPLRPPGPLVVGPLPLLWLVLAGTTAAGPLLLAAGAWVAGALVSLLAVALLVVLPRRFHRLSRRFLVFVPAGLALHDHVVLVETAMFRWPAVGAVERAMASTGALDLTAGALGPALEVRLAAVDTVVVAGRDRAATSVRTSGVLCSPTLLDAALAEAARRRGQEAVAPPST